MKAIDKKDMPKLIALIAMAVLLVGYVALQVLSASGPAAAGGKKSSDTTASATAPGAAGSTAGGTAAGGAAAAAAAASIAGVNGPLTVASFEGAGINLLTTGRDPFVPNGPVATFMQAGGVGNPKPSITAPAPVKPVIPQAAAYSAASQRLDRALGLPQSYSRPGLPSGGWAELRGDGVVAGAAGPGTGAAGAVTAAPAQAVSVPPPPPPAFTVTGVVLSGGSGTDAAQDVAILRGGSGAGDSSERRFVTVGDPVGNGFVVASISRAGVEIKSGPRRFTLKIGKSGEESRAN